jgi:phosphatidylinositol alpha-1,6-mannosyltransferase
MPATRKVLFIARRFPPSVGGMERFAFDLSGALQKETPLSMITWGGSNKWLPVVLPWFFLRASWQLLTDRQIDIIHMQDSVQAPIGWLLSKLFRRPYVVIVHGLDITYPKFGYQKLIPPFVRRADAVIAISAAAAQEATARGVKKEKIQTIPLGIHDDFGDAQLPDKSAVSEAVGSNITDKLLLLTTGRLVKRKGVEWFISNVLPAVVQKHPEVLYIVVGEGAERTAIENAIIEQGLSSHVKLMGRVSDDVRALLYRSADTFVMPNIVVPGDIEGFGIVVQEAASAGLPVVASDLQGIKDALTNGQNGILVQTEDSKAFEKEIITLLEDPTSRREFGARAREYTLREYGWERIANEYVKVYERLRSRDRAPTVIKSTNTNSKKTT